MNFRGWLKQIQNWITPWEIQEDLVELKILCPVCKAELSLIVPDDKKEWEIVKVITCSEKDRWISREVKLGHHSITSQYYCGSSSLVVIKQEMQVHQEVKICAKLVETDVYIK